MSFSAEPATTNPSEDIMSSKDEFGFVEPIFLLKNAWDKDFHHAKEISNLLKEREEYFSGQMDDTFYRVGLNGDPVYFPKSRTRNKSLSGKLNHQAVEDDNADQEATASSNLKLNNLNLCPHLYPQDNYDTINDWVKKSIEALEDKTSEKEEFWPALTPRKSEPIMRKNNKPGNFTTSSKPMMKTKKQLKTSYSARESPKESRSEPVVQMYPSRVLKATMSSCLKQQSKHDPNSYKIQENSQLRSDMKRCGISMNENRYLTKQTVEEARAHLRKAEAIIRDTKTDTGDHRVKQVLNKKDRIPSMDLQEKALLKKASKPLPASKMDLSKGDAALLDAFRMINIDPAPFLDLKPKGPNGVIVPKMETLRRNFKRRSQ